MSAAEPIAEQATDDLISVWRSFGAFERESVCCGTVTVQQCLVLQSLRDSDATVSELASSTGGSASAMTRLIDGLVKKAWVTRHRDGKDRRRAHLSLTEDGRAEADRLHAVTRTGVALLFEQIPEEERSAVGRALGLIRGALDNVRGGVGFCC